ncbi:hypothetical protein CLV92_106169 [Kineococcus xinjiangensis]|uniref:ABC-2 type transport system permease protein n=1 Tax=Kineococcus xinjiangensis TaxID=512762 RepID=A0A2S6IMB4_9ACTN|nr:DUF6297 family protein [Kineococcus xinjiangensis]PPK95348.1 hypothetical protein CLV92_106169 [Kineococcus xinjiangensis]
MRGWTRRRARARSVHGLGALLEDLYTALLAFAMTAASLLSVAEDLGADLRVGRGAPVVDGPFLDPGWIAVLLAAAGVVALAGLAARTGPVSLTWAQSAWWLPLPVDRRTLLRPAALRWPAVAAVLGAAPGAGLVLVLAARPDATALACGAVLGAATAAAAVLLPALAQTAGAEQAARRVADTALAALPLAGVLVAVLAVPRLVLSVPPALPVLVVLATCGAAFAVDVLSPMVRDRSLREHGDTTGQAHLALLSLDLGGLSAALSAQRRVRVRPVSRLLAASRWPTARWRAPAALVCADLLLLLRTPRALLRLAVTACLPVAALAAPSPWPVVLAVLVGGYAGAAPTAAAVRAAQLCPALDALLPLGDAAVRAHRMVVPVAATALWGAAAGALLGLSTGGVGEWVLLGALAGPVWGAAAVRAARRPAPDFARPLIATPMGAVPTGLGAALATGPDVALVGALPMLLALVGSGPSPLLVPVQAVLTVLALLVAAATGSSRPR